MRIEHTIPIFDPHPYWLPERVDFAFPRAIRDYWMKVAGGKCQTHFYSEKWGWYVCGKEAKEVDHIVPESELKHQGVDPDQSVGIPRCKECHTGTGLIHDDDGSVRLADYGEPGWSKHPDIGRALQDYRRGDKEAFKKAVKHHYEQAKNGNRFWNTTPEIDQFEIDHMMNLARQKGIAKPRRRRSL